MNRRASINAIQGAAFAGARHVIAIDPVASKREAALRLGAAHSAASAGAGRGRRLGR